VVPYIEGLTTQAPHDEQVRLDLKCDARSVATARNAVAELARRVGAEVDDVRIAVSEAVANSVVHAYRGMRPRNISVEARPERGLLVVVVADQGIGMTPNPDGPGLRVGIPLITKVCDDVRFASSDEGTIVSMSFATSIPGGGA
jgi:anti-sigma regulatory factor (Ser/Thr protein kinase)